MRSVMYLVFGKPCTFDDCVDSVRSRSVSNAVVKLEQEEMIHENCFGTALYARIRLHYEKDKARVARVFCGSFRDSWMYADRLNVYDKANTKLEKCLMQISTLGATLEGADKRFGATQLTCKQVAPQDPASATADFSKKRDDQQTSEASPYSRFANGQLILRDELAIDRTLLANERTLLAYLRSGIALVIAGVSIIHFATYDWFLVVGFGCLPVGLITGMTGVVRYRTMNRGISTVRKKMKTSAEQPPAGDSLKLAPEE